MLNSSLLARFLVFSQSPTLPPIRPPPLPGSVPTARVHPLVIGQTTRAIPEGRLMQRNPRSPFRASNADVLLRSATIEPLLPSSKRSVLRSNPEDETTRVEQKA